MRIYLERIGYNGSIILVEKDSDKLYLPSSNLQAGCRIDPIQDRSVAGKDACRTGRMQERTHAEQERCRTGWMQDRTDAGQDGCRTG